MKKPNPQFVDPSSLTSFQEVAEVRSTVSSLIKQANKLWKLKLKEPAIGFYRYGKRIAWASRDTLAISLEVLLLYKDIMINDVLPHEVAHYVVINTDADYKHSKLWQTVAVTLGNEKSGTVRVDIPTGVSDGRYRKHAKNGGKLSSELADALNELT